MSDQYPGRRSFWADQRGRITWAPVPEQPDGNSPPLD